jgi:hypothetical protein
MSKAQNYVEKVRVSWGDDNDNTPNDGYLSADLLEGYKVTDLPISKPVQVEITRIDGELANKPTGTWTFDGTTLSITGVPAP